MELAKACSDPKPVEKSSCASGATRCTSSAMARPSSVPVAKSVPSTLTTDGRSPFASSAATSLAWLPEASKLSEMMPILMPAPVTPKVPRAAGAFSAMSPASLTLLVIAPSGAGVSAIAASGAKTSAVAGSAAWDCAGSARSGDARMIGANAVWSGCIWSAAASGQSAPGDASPGAARSAHARCSAVLPISIRMSEYPASGRLYGAMITRLKRNERGWPRPG